MFGLGTTELIIILVIIVLLFGASKLPQIGKGIGEAISNFKKATSGTNDNEEAHKSISDKTGK
ncbi:MAG: twin-arginine translocase TatA/TatE family subunit [Nitrospirae bacterium]|nr:twin-arginine translocase TatA/TatE family subunit [Nitrospirota bacterium]